MCSHGLHAITVCMLTSHKKFKDVTHLLYHTSTALQYTTCLGQKLCPGPTPGLTAIQVCIPNRMTQIGSSPAAATTSHSNYTTSQRTQRCWLAINDCTMVQVLFPANKPCFCPINLLLRPDESTIFPHAHYKLNQNQTHAGVMKTSVNETKPLICICCNRRLQLVCSNPTIIAAPLYCLCRPLVAYTTFARPWSFAAWSLTPATSA